MQMHVLNIAWNIDYLEVLQVSSQSFPENAKRMP
jgi:hypothetical protein